MSLVYAAIILDLTSWCTEQCTYVNVGNSFAGAYAAFSPPGGGGGGTYNAEGALFSSEKRKMFLNV